MPRRPFELLAGEAYQNPQFSSGAVAEILNIEVWELQNFLNSPRYPLSPSGQLGHGKGSRRWFTTKDIYRLGIATFLTRDGFTPKLISQILQDIENHDFLEFDADGEVCRRLILSRTEGGIKVRFVRAENPVKLGKDVYYSLDLSDVTSEIDRRINEAQKKVI